MIAWVSPFRKAIKQYQVLGGLLRAGVAAKRRCGPHARGNPRGHQRNSNSTTLCAPEIIDRKIRRRLESNGMSHLQEKCKILKQLLLFKKISEDFVIHVCQCL